MSDTFCKLLAENGPNFSWVIPLIVFLVYIIGGIARFLQQMKEGKGETGPAEQAKSPRDVRSSRRQVQTSDYRRTPPGRRQRIQSPYQKQQVQQPESQWQKLVRQTEKEAKAIGQTGLKSAEIQQTPEIKSMEQAMRDTEKQGLEVPNLTRDVAKELQDPQSLRKAVIFSEILKPPVCMRDGGWI